MKNLKRFFFLFVLVMLPSLRAEACYLQTADAQNLASLEFLCESTYSGTWTQDSYYGGPRSIQIYGSCYVPGSGYGGSYSTFLQCDSDATPPPTDPNNPPDSPNTCSRGSIIQNESRLVQENISIAGTSFFLNHSSDRQFAYVGYRTKYVEPWGPDCVPIGSPFCPASRNIEIRVGDRLFQTSVLPGTPGTGFNFVWDGKDNSGNFVLGSAQFEIKVLDDPPNIHEVPTTYRSPIGSFYAILIGLGGWTISPVHFYDVQRKMVFTGSGATYGASATVLPGPTYRVVSDDGQEIYYFDSTGRHTQTKSALKGATLYTITYVNGKISTISDTFSNVTTINYTNGKPSSIVGPYGHTTTLSTNTDGYITSVTNPASETFNITYWNFINAPGFIQTFEKPNGVTTSLTYADYRVQSDSSTAGNSISFSLVSPTSHSATTAEGVVTEYIGTRSFRATQGPGQFYENENYSYDPTNQTLYQVTGYDRFGRNFNWAKTPDPRLSSGYYLSYSSEGPSGLQRVESRTRSATLSDQNDIFSVVDWTETTTLNSTKTTTLAYLASTSRYTKTSPVGRKRYSTIDSQERLSSWQYATFQPITYSYDSRNRVSTVAQGSSRTTTLSYDSSGNLQSITNPLNQISSYTYDSVGRLLTETLPDSRVISYSYDVNGNLASVTPPSGLAHTFISNGFDLIEQYSAPAISFAMKRAYNSFLGWLKNLVSDYFPTASKKISTLTVNLNTDYDYDNDRNLTLITRPDATTASFSYSGPARQLTGITTPLGSYTISQNAYRDQVDSITSPDGVTTSYTYDGPLLVQNSNSGATSGSVYLTYNYEHQIASTKVNTATTLNYVYDNDGLVTTAGNETVTRSSTTGFPTKTTLSTANENYTYSTSFGELASIQGKYGTTTNVYQSVLTRDDLARVVQKVETVGASSANTFAYTFDSSGRLTTVLKNSAAHSSYNYDSNSNRTSVTRGGVTTTATFDEQDRIVTFGTKTYTHNDAGELVSISDSSTTPASVTSYTYDVFGNLKSVTLPNSTVITYLLDGQNRRVGKKIGTTLQKQFVWFDQLRPAGELNGSGTLVSQFVYGIKGNVPDYIIKGSVRYKLMTDHLGSVVAVVHSTNGTIAQRIEYDEFGRVLSDTSPGFQPFGFAGGLYDSDTKLVTFGVRTYDADTGRWLSKDPILFGGGQTNLFGYVNNDPVNFIDPSGTLSETQWRGVIGGAIGGAIGGGIWGSTVPGVGTVSGAIGGAFFGAALGGAIAPAIANASPTPGCNPAVATCFNPPSPAPNVCPR